jgi:hypothetical protein
MKKIKSAIAAIVFVVAMTGAFAFTSAKFSTAADYFDGSTCKHGTTIENVCLTAPVTTQCTVQLTHGPTQAFLLNSSCLTPIYKQ